VTATSWAPRDDIPIVHWVEQGRWLGTLSRGTGWWIGDWIRYGNARYGDKYAAAAAVAGLGEEDQDVWLDRAEAGGLSVRSLRMELRAARRRREARLSRASARATRAELLPPPRLERRVAAGRRARDRPVVAPTAATTSSPGTSRRREDLRLRTRLKPRSLDFKLT
jgi:hypothetical protein